MHSADLLPLCAIDYAASVMSPANRSLLDATRGKHCLGLSMDLLERPPRENILERLFISADPAVEIDRTEA